MNLRLSLGSNLNGEALKCPLCASGLLVFERIFTFNYQNITMKGLKLLLISGLIMSALGLSAQVEYITPYNPDADEDELIGAGDLLVLLAFFGEGFTADPILMDGISLDEYLNELSQSFFDLQAQVENLSSALNDLENLHQNDPCDGVSAVHYHGVSYPVVAILGKCWFAENLRTAFFQNGDTIPLVQDSTDWAALESMAFCFPENPRPEAGFLYNRWTLNQGIGNPASQNICPAGWRVPNHGDYDDLVEAHDSLWQPIIGGMGDALKNSKETTDWANSETNNHYRFDAIPVNYRHPNGSFQGDGETTWFHINTTYGGGSSGFRKLTDNSAQFLMSQIGPWNYGVSIRCMHD